MVELSHLQEFPIWPGVAPGSEGVDIVETIEERSSDPALPDRAITRVLRPTLTAFLPERPNGAAMLVAPGGGYVRHAIDNEGYTFAKWLNGLGITAFVLKYRLPCDGHRLRDLVALQDAQRAMRLIREGAERWGLGPDRIGAIGSSAGGHLIASLATRFDEAAYASVDGADQVSARPNAVVLMYPVITMDPLFAHAGSRASLLGDSPSEAMQHASSCERNVRPETPPTFLSHANDDPSVDPENSIRFYLALRAAGVSAEMHIFESGGHGHGISYAAGPERQWTGLCETWLQARLMR